MSHPTGHVARFADVKKTREKSRAPKDSTTPAAEKASAGSVRGRGRGGSESARGGRGRGGAERGRTTSRGGRGAATTAARTAAAAAATTTTTASVPTTESSGWGEPKTVASTAADAAWDTPAAAATSAAPEAWGQTTSTTDAWSTPSATEITQSDEKKSSVIPQGTKKSWASMLAPAKVAPAVPKVAVSAAPVQQPQPEVGKVQDAPSHLLAEADAAVTPDDSLNSQPGAYQRMPSGTNSIDLTPPKDRLTEDNLDNLPDTSIPPATDTVASTRDASSMVGSGTPLYNGQQQPQPIGRPPVGGYAATAWRATGTPGRSASYQRKLLEQQEAVVMPGNHAVDRATVQFGSMGLGGDDNKPADFDDDREDTETRAQPPQQSPAQPRASLPPAPQQQAVPQDPSLHEAPSAPKQAPGLPPLSQQPIPGQQAYGQYGRYAPGLGQDHGASAQKGYDPFSQQLNYQGEQQSQYPGGGSQVPTSAAPSTTPGTNDYASHYGSQDQRNSYQNYYGSGYGGQQDHAQPPQRSASGLGASDSAYGTQQSQSRFGDAPGSGHNTPAPPGTTQQQTGPQSHQQAPHGQGQQGAGYGYGAPYYQQGSYYNNYMNQVRQTDPSLEASTTQTLTHAQYPGQYGGYSQQGYGGPYGGKGGMYGQSHQGYGMPPQGSYEHSSSPANASGFGHNSMQSGRDSAFGSSGANEYSRAGSTQASQTASQPAGYGGAADGYGRSSSGFGGAHGQYGGSSSAAADESSKAYDSKTGPSPALGQPGRTGSAMNNSAQGSQSGYAPPGNAGYGGYPNHINQAHNSYGSQHGGLGGLGAQPGASGQTHQSGGFGGYGGGGYNSQYGSYGRGGWGGNYTH